MLIDTHSTQQIDASSLGLALAKSSPEEFAAFFFELSQSLEAHPKRQDEFGKAMSASLGRRRLECLRSILKIADYHAMLEDRAQSEKP